MGRSRVYKNKNAFAMNAASPLHGTNPVDVTAGSAESRDLVDYLASHHPLDAEAAVWLARQQDGLTPEEEAEWCAWLAGDPARGARLEQLSGLWGQLGDLPSDDIAALKAALPRAHGHGIHQADSGSRTGKPQALPPTRPEPSGVRQSGRRQWLLDWGRLVPQAAMAGLAAMVVGGGWLGWGHWQQRPVFEQSFASKRGQQISVALPEGSTLRLDTATRVEVAIYRDRREVHLPQGQALFDVRSDSERPWHVFAGPMRITVLGTRFAVRHTQDGLEPGRVHVVVEEGRVRVARDGVGHEAMSASPAFVELTAGQRVTADAQGRIAGVAAAFPGTAMAWRDGRVVLSDTPLGEAVAEFERYMDTGLTILDPAVAALRLNGSFELLQLQAFKRAIPQVLPVRLALRPDGKTEIVAGH